MSSQTAKELRALALSLSLVNDDLKNKRYLRKSEFYKESDRYKKEREARKLAALNLAKELSSKTPTISAALVNAVNNAPPEVVGHAGDEEIKEGDFKTTTVAADNIFELLGQTKSLTTSGIQEAIKNLRKIPEERAAAKRQKGLADTIFSEIIDRKIDDVYKNFNNAVDISPEQLRRANREQLMRLKRRYQEIDEEEFPTSADAGKIINQHLTIIENRLGLMERQERAEAELQRRARVIAKPTGVEEKKGGDSDGEELPKPTRPRLKRKPTPPAGPPPPSIVARRGRGRPKSKEVQERKQMALEDPMPKKPRGRPRKKPVEEEAVAKKPRGRPRKNKEPIVSQRQADITLEEMLRQRQKALEPITKEQAEEIMKQRAEEIMKPKATRIIERTAEAPTAIEGEGLKDYMNYMKGKKPTKDMKKLILLIGSQQAGNNSYKLKVEIEKLIHKIKHDLEDKISKHKSKIAKEEIKAIELEKRKLLIREEAKRRLREEAKLK